jgi:hypothetical protein
MPEAGQEETVRVVALDRSFHIACYKCEVGCASGECREERHEDVKMAVFFKCSKYIEIR